MDHPYFEPCGGRIETVYQVVSVFLVCIYDNVICKAEVGNKPSSDAYTVVAAFFFKFIYLFFFFFVNEIETQTKRKRNENAP